MGRRRKRIARCVYRDQYGLACVVSVGRLQRERRFSPETSLKAIRRWEAEVRATLRAALPREVRGTLNGDAPRYERQIRHLASWREAMAEVRAWCRLYGRVSRSRLSPEQVRIACGLWKDEGLAPKTINHRLFRLKHLYHMLDGVHAPTPADDVAALPVPRQVVHPVSPDIIRAVEATMREHERRGWLRSAKTRARFMVLASTGRRPSEVMRTEPGDVDLERRLWRVRDGKNGWSPGVYLNDDMRAGWAVFIAADAWGRFSTKSFPRVLRQCGWPAGVRPYQLRHSVGMALSESGTDLADVSAHLGHTRPSTTRQYYVPVLGTRLQRASELLNGRLGWGKRQSDEA